MSGSTAQRAHGFEQHLRLVLKEWSTEKLMCLQHNLTLVNDAEVPRIARSAERATSKPLTDPQVRQRVSVIDRHVADILQDRETIEGSPEQLMLRMADVQVNLTVLTDWINDKRVTH